MTTIISFKSKPEYFRAEQENLKRNTVRFTDDWTESRWYNFKSANKVMIENTENEDDMFVRDITHKCVYKNIAIISW